MTRDSEKAAPTAFCRNSAPDLCTTSRPYGSNFLEWDFLVEWFDTSASSVWSGNLTQSPEVDGCL
jgi:hypothetical protein